MSRLRRRTLQADRYRLDEGVSHVSPMEAVGEVKESKKGRPTSVGRVMATAGIVAALGIGGVMAAEKTKGYPHPAPSYQINEAGKLPSLLVVADDRQVDLNAFVANSPKEEVKLRAQMLAKIRRVFSDATRVEKRSKEDVVKAYARRYGFDAGLFLTRCKQVGLDPLEGVVLEDVESDYKSGASSGVGAEGRAQLMPQTGKAVWANCTREFVDLGDYSTWSKLTKKPAKESAGEWKKLVEKRKEHLEFLTSYGNEMQKVSKELSEWKKKIKLFKKDKEKKKEAEAGLAEATKRRKQLRDRKAAIPGEWAATTERTYNPRDPDQANWLMLTYYGKEVGGVVPSSMTAADAIKARASAYNYGPFGLRKAVQAVGGEVTWDKILVKLPKESVKQGKKVGAYYDILSQITGEQSEVSGGKKAVEGTWKPPTSGGLSQHEMRERQRIDEQRMRAQLKSNSRRG